MRRFFAPAAIAAAVMAIVPSLALADDNGDDVSGLNPNEAGVTAPDNTTFFDLGIDISNVGSGTAAVRSFILGLGPQTQAAVMGACEHYMQNPATAETPSETLPFCESAVGG